MTHLPDFTAARVLVVGDIMLDRYWHGATARISPEAPVPVVRIEQAVERAGGAGNVALNIAALGAQVTLLGLTGKDEAADILQTQLSAANVNCAFEQVQGYSTITKLRVLSRHQQLIRLDFEDGFTDHIPANLVERFKKLLPQADVVVLSDYGKGALRAVGELIELARQAGKRVLVDPKGADFDIYRGATLITPNLAEFETVVGHCRDEQELVAKGEQLRRRLDLHALLITRSERGMTLLCEGTEALHLPAHAREVYDVTGAGDTVVSVLAAALAAGEDYAVATALANAAASIVVGKLGAATVSTDELRSAMGEGAAGSSALLTEDELLAAVAEARARGERVVMTNGCFDILHAGHVSYLEQAKRLGDRLIVAVNDDASVRRLKGNGDAQRPVNPLAQRMRVLAALKSVDWVVPFSEDTPERLICRVLPDILVKGGDYQPQQVAGHQCVTAHGGQVRILGYEQGISTSRIIENIRTDNKGSTA
ncbi:MAG TPA: bifunctional D-glycero-beta-D-manno-heptose-7-phosphate kinase/D-glycero-beta-D-manno-heptose 1-phosphate adenylyltransferase HldE [Gammaproteobacteria bacterium]|nr:bifunctional D-glycero-beta-D-manno-heptose-7-phosphate kinase/D-glycero-beta-D-manno-heptose 1-phosphate adenylyltransferase HldE [Gammaproteobacteria bacterium]